MVLDHLAPFLAALVLSVTPVQFVQGHASGGAFSEQGGTADAALTSWAVLGLTAAGQPPQDSLAYLQAQEPTLAATTDIALVALAEQSLGVHPAALLDRLQRATDAERPDRPDGQLDVLVGAGARALVDADDSLAARAPGQERRLLLGRRRSTRLERHRRRARGLARRGRPRHAGRPRGRVLARLPEP